jgi:hypothetical protein
MSMQVLIRCEERVSDVLYPVLSGDVMQIALGYCQLTTPELEQHVQEYYGCLAYSSDNYNALLYDLHVATSRLRVTQLAGYSGRNTERDWYTIVTHGGYRGKRGIWNALIRKKNIS